MRRTASSLLVALLFLSLFAFTLNVRAAKIEIGPIYINPDGTITPQNANVTSPDYVTYDFVDNNYLPIVVNRSNIIIDGNGYTLQAPGGTGFSLTDMSNVTIKNTTITHSNFGIVLDSSSGNVLSGNNVTATAFGIDLISSSGNVLSGNNVRANDNGIRLTFSSDNNTLSRNNVTANINFGIDLSSSSGNVLSSNNLTTNNDGIALFSSSSNVLSGNNLIANHFGIYLASSSDNRVFHNDFFNSTQQVFVLFESTNTWDDGYPSGGNYWSNYNGADLHRGPYQNITGSDGIGDMPYTIDANNTDRYPIMHPWSSLPVHDINTGLGYSTIQEGINAPQTLNGHTILVDSGTYNEILVINKSISLIGENANNTIIDGMGKGDIVDIDADHVVLSRFTIVNSENQAGYAGIESSNTENGSINENNILNNWRGIWLYNTSNYVIQGNNIENTTESLAIWVEESNGIVISTNVITNNACGVYLFYSDNNLVSRNRIVNNSFYSLTLAESNSTMITENIIENTTEWDGIALWDSYYNTLAANNIVNNPIGLRIGFSSNNTIYHNNFINNTVQIHDAYREYNSTPSTNFWSNDNFSEGNYWSNYTGIDANGDGIGDTPHELYVNNTDHYPLMKPFIQGDVNHSGKVDIMDAALVGLSWQKTAGSLGYNPHADLNMDGIVNMADADILRDNWQTKITQLLTFLNT